MFVFVIWFIHFSKTVKSTPKLVSG